MEDVLWINLGEFEKLEKKYLKKVKNKSKDPEDFVQLGMSYFYMEKYKKSITYYKKALKISNCNKLSIYGLIANSFDYSNQKEKALEFYEKALKTNPLYFPALLDKGKLLAELGDFKKGIECMDAVIEMVPKNVDAYYTKGNMLRDTGIIEEAKEQFKKAIKIDPEHRSALINLGNIYKNEKHLEKALKHYDKALSLSSNYPDTLVAKAEVLLMQDKINEAEYFFVKAHENANLSGTNSKLIEVRACNGIEKIKKKRTLFSKIRKEAYKHWQLFATILTLILATLALI